MAVCMIVWFTLLLFHLVFFSSLHFVPSCPHCLTFAMFSTWFLLCCPSIPCCDLRAWMTNLTEVLYPVCPAVSCCVYLASVSLLQQVESCSLDACVETEFCPVSCIIVSRQGLLSVSGTCVRLHGPQTGGYYSIHDWKPHYFRLHLVSPLVPRLSRQHFGLMYSAQYQSLWFIYFIWKTGSVWIKRTFLLISADTLLLRLIGESAASREQCRQKKEISFRLWLTYQAFVLFMPIKYIFVLSCWKIRITYSKRMETCIFSVTRRSRSDVCNTEWLSPG